MEMYHERPRGDETYAFLVWGVQMFCLYIAGKFADNSLVYWCTGVIAPGLAILISLKHDHSLKELGLYPNHLKRDLAVMLCAFAAELLIGVYIYGMSLEYALPAIAYYIVWIAVPEEILFRGLIQSHLFSLPVNRKLVYCMGAALFAASHIPYQMQIRTWDALFTVQLGITFVTHLVLCWIVRKRGNMCLPLAIHVAQDFLQVI